MLEAYRKAAAERAALGIPPLPLNAQQTADLVELLKNPPAGEGEFLVELLAHRVPPGVDDAAKVKASFLAAVAEGSASSPLVSPEYATELLGTMLGGYNIHALIELLDNDKLAPIAAKGLKHTLLMFDSFHDVQEKAEKGNKYAQEVLQSWADAEWFTSRAKVPEKITVTVFKVDGETNTDDLSPAPDAWSRPDIPLHALAMLKNPRDGINPDKPGEVGPIKLLEELKAKGHPVAYVGDVVGTGSSRKSATNSVIWHTGEDIPFVPNKRFGGVCLGGKIAPIFFNTQEDSGALPIEVDVSALKMGDVVDILPYEGKIVKNGETVAEFSLKSQVLLDEVQAGGRINLIIGRGLTAKAREALKLPASTEFRLPQAPAESKAGFTLAQKMVGRACGLPEGQGVRPGTYCEPRMTTVGSQDTTGPMTRDELKDLACLGFSADMVMQSFCHTAAYPKPVDVRTHKELPAFISTRGGVALRPGDGVIHSWLNRLLLPDTVGTGGDSHTRFPIGISFPAGSGLVAFAAATGVMPLDMPESVLVRFSGKLQGCTVKLNKEPIIEYMKSNVVLMKNMIADGYQDPRTLERRIKAMEKWLANPELLEADKDAEYAAVIEINMDDIKEPIIACPNDPDDVCFMSERSGTKIDEVFIGSCMTNIGHFRAASKLLEGKSDIPVRLWMAPPTKMDAKELSDEGHYGVLGRAGARMEMPGCSLCMGNQAQVHEGATVMSTSTRNFPNRLGKNTFVYLGSAELAAICSKLGKIPTVEEYQANIGIINEQGDQIYRYMNFNEIDSYNEVAETVNV